MNHWIAGIVLYLVVLVLVCAAFHAARQRNRL